MRSRLLILGCFSFGICADSPAGGFLYDSDVRVLSREAELGYRRTQRFDRDYDGPPGGNRDLPAVSNRAYGYLRSDAFAVIPGLFQPGGDYSNCGKRAAEREEFHPDKPVSEAGGERITCNPTLTAELEGGFDFNDRNGDVSSTWGALNLYYPLIYSNENGLYDPYDWKSVTAGLSIDARHSDGSGRESDRSMIQPTLFLRGELRGEAGPGKWPLKDSGPFEGQGDVNDFGLSAELGWVPHVFFDDDDSKEQSWYAAAEVSVGSDHLEKRSLGDPEKMIRLKYRDVYDADRRSFEGEQWAAELNLSWLLPAWKLGFGKVENSNSGLFFELAFGYEEEDGREHKASGAYVAPAIYWRWTPGDSGGQWFGTNRNNLNWWWFYY